MTDEWTNLGLKEALDVMSGLERDLREIAGTAHSGIRQQKIAALPAPILDWIVGQAVERLAQEERATQEYAARRTKLIDEAVLSLVGTVPIDEDNL